ncbi:phosphoribosylaminoimidazolecarboxamide formyltransferase [Kitasatospora sp. NBC_01287]|uniref:phosphoribosylaminoimidazolecarboxamide formyltransferase n=1 Tax=Kitasatospora sp. NBC_01287 TaxID=2903573 RepID=UPI00225C18F2|nr:phosphoribosylaminoimidazolecarboxamide formyltransferase [Kitasatospora sp. NBC_01287]MCX4750143.1 phosphoribosylaminoimidazolecarboxamide formyltransferase [Kitasatospora sp. NBC_01287]
MKLRYGMNPHQTAAPVVPVRPGEVPVRVLNGEPSYINLLDALNAWQLVGEASRALGGQVAAASFKHVSPAGAALAGPVDEAAAELHGVGPAGLGAVTSAYLRARDADPKSSYGDFAALSHPVDAELAELLATVVCDGIIAPDYHPGVVERLGRKKGGRFLVLAADPAYRPPAREARQVYGLRLEQERDQVDLTPELLRPAAGEELDPAAVTDLLLGLAVLRYTQSNSVCYVRDGVTVGIGAGQQSRVDCTRLAGAKADLWWLRRHPAVRALEFRPEVRRQDRINWQLRHLEGETPAADLLAAPAPELTDRQRSLWLAGLTDVRFTSDGALPFRDNVDHAARHGVTHIAEPGGSVRSAEVEQACREHGITLARTGLRLFHH